MGDKLTDPLLSSPQPLGSNIHHDEGLHIPKHSETDFKLYPKRWVVLLGFSVVSMVNAIVWIGFSAITDDTKEAYNINDKQVNMLSLCFMFAYLPVMFLASVVTDRLGLVVGVISGAFLTCFGAWARYSSIAFEKDWQYTVVLVGQCLAAVGQPFILASPPKLAAQWFGEDERALATSLGAGANLLGVALGFVIAAVSVSKASDLPILLLVHGIMSTLCLFFAMLTIRERPATAPSPAATAPHTSYLKSFPHLFKNIDFVLLLITFSLGLGVLNAVGTMVDQMIKPRGYSPMDSAVVGAATIVCGGIGTLVLGFVVEKFKNYQQMLSFGYIMSVICFSCFILSLYGDRTYFRYVAFITSGLNGFFLTSMLPISFEVGVEYTFPVDEATSSGWLMWGGQVAGIGMIFMMMGLKAEDGSMFLPLWIMAGLVMIAATTALCFLSRHYVRMEEEQEDMEALEGDDGRHRAHHRTFERRPLFFRALRVGLGKSKETQ